MQKVEDVKRPLKKGERYLVPCIVRHEGLENPIEEIVKGKWEMIMDKMYVTPVINHPHNDVENGQREQHYHVDYRFVKHKNDGNFPRVVNNHSRHVFVESIRPVADAAVKLKYIELPVINEEFMGITEVELISKSKLKHRCIHKGKCPHRGYNLSQVAPVDGVITCPLHGLQFDAITKQMIK